MASIFEKNPDNKIYYSPTPGHVTIMAGMPNPSAGLVTDDLCKENYLRFAVFTALAYGAKGIQYLTFNMKRNDNNEFFISSMLDRNGNKTATFYYVKKINSEILKYQDIFLNVKIAKVTHVTEGVATSFLNKSIYFLLSLGAESILVSELTSNNKTYLMVVSKNVLRPQSFTLTVSSGEIKEITPLTSTKYDEKFILREVA